MKKNLYKIVNTLVLVILVLSTYSCSDLETLEQPSAPVLGAKSTKTQIISVIPTGSKVTVTYNLTVGAKYSVQVYAFGASEPVKTLPLTALEEITTKVYEFGDLQNGLYDLTLTDIEGVTTKKPIIIKR